MENPIFEGTVKEMLEIADKSRLYISPYNKDIIDLLKGSDPSKTVVVTMGCSLGPTESIKTKHK